MLADKDRIFTNLCGYQPRHLKAAPKRGDWDGAKALPVICSATLKEMVR